MGDIYLDDVAEYKMWHAKLWVGVALADNEYNFEYYAFEIYGPV